MSESIKNKIKREGALKERIKVLKRASEINPDFKNPCIVGGFLRDLALDEKPVDCDVFFEGKTREQPGIIECVRQAEKELGVGPFSDWEFENILTTGVIGDIYEDTIGFYSNHTDYLTMLMCNTDCEIVFGSDKTPKYLKNRTYDIRYQGFLVWMGFRDRGYFRSLAGVASRALYLCHRLKLNPSESAEKLVKAFDYNFEKLNQKEKKGMLTYWKKKTQNLVGIDEILSKYNIKNLKPML